MTKIDIISGFLGAGKTTLIRKLLEGPLKGQKVVLIENEFGEIGIDGGFLKDSGIQINEMNSGCICCTLVGDFEKALGDVLSQYAPDRIIIEPSGVGKLSDVAAAVQPVLREGEVEMGCMTTVCDASKCRMYIKNFGEFYVNQLESAGTIVLSRTQNVSDKRLDEALKLIREHCGENTSIITTPWDDLTGEQMVTRLCSTPLSCTSTRSITTIIMTVKPAPAVTTMTTTSMRSMSIIITTARPAPAAITIMTMTSTSTIMNIIMMRTACAPAVIIITATMPTKYSRAGASRQHASSPRTICVPA